MMMMPLGELDKSSFVASGSEYSNSYPDGFKYVIDGVVITATGTDNQMWHVKDAQINTWVQVELRKFGSHRPIT